MGRFLQWWRQGETQDAAVFRYSWRAAIGAALATGALLWFFPAMRAWYLIGTLAVCLARSAAERRRAIIFTHDTVVLRPALGRATGFLLAEVRSVGPSTVRVFRYLRPRLVDGLRVEFSTCGPVYFPLDFRRADEIRARFTSAARAAVPPGATRSLP